MESKTSWEGCPSIQEIIDELDTELQNMAPLDLDGLPDLTPLDLPDLDLDLPDLDGLDDLTL